MNLLKKSMCLAKVLAFALSFVLLCLPTAAMAATDSFFEGVEESIDIKGGTFVVDKPNGKVPEPTRISSAVVSLKPPNETGTINWIKITGPDKQVEFQCSGIAVQNNTDLIKACGGPAILQPGLTTYQAGGSNFGPDTSSTLSVDLIN
ncbi:hypothetical protein [Nostoc sp.]|uniref:hypothetical protein n=1 Tax=Nostoc sp. TaxID=1180 RepID=UPI002FF79EE7